MSTFSSISCYAALFAFSNKDLLQAYVRMVIALVQEKRYKTCEIDSICEDFKDFYGFSIPYHPMHTIFNECIRQKYFTYNNSIHKRLPDYGMIDREDFMKIVQQKNSEYQKLLTMFGDFLKKTHNIYSSNDDLNEKIVAFIERYGVKTQTDKSIIKKVKNDYLFAEFLVHCEESGDEWVMDYLDEYTVGLALSEIMVFNEKTEKLMLKGTTVYLDAGIIFRLLGIDSSNRANCYLELVKNMKKSGMRLAVYEHTVAEIIGIIENSRQWIGNPDFNATLCSEATYFFVTNNWTVEKVNEFSCNIKTKLREDYNIFIDSDSYPKVDDIKTIFEADIKEQIVNAYMENDPEIDLKEKDFSIDQDAKSIFLTQHKNGNTVACHIDDIKNIFITSNRALAKVGYNISYEIAASKEHFIPVVMNDIKWGTLVWFNSPAILSSINRPRLVSAAYAAFRPSDDVVSKLNSKLQELEENGQITPEQCYLLKVSPVAQQLLAKKTINDPDRFVDATALEILKDMEKQAFQKGCSSRQEEIDLINEEKENNERLLCIERQKNVISQKSKEYELTKKKVENTKKQLTIVIERLDEYYQIKKETDKIVNGIVFSCKILFTVVLLTIIALGFYVSYKWSWLFGAIIWAVPFIVTVLGLWKIKKLSLKELMLHIEKRIDGSISKIKHYSKTKVSELEKQKEELLNQKEVETKELYVIENSYKSEKEKLDGLSADISIFV